MQRAKRAKQAANEGNSNESRFELAFENAPIGMAIVDFDYRLRRVNNSLCAALGYDADELMKRKFVEITHPDDVRRDRDLADRLFRGKIPFYRLEKRFVTKQGALAWLDLTALLVRDKNGKPLYGLAMVEDITNRKRSEEALRVSEERYRSFVVNSSEGIWRLEVENPIEVTLPAKEQLRRLMKYGYLAECNDAFARIYGRDRAEDVIGARLGNLSQSQSPSTLVSLEELIRNNYRLRDWPTEIVTHDNQRKHLATSLLGIVINGMLMRVWSVQSDQTERQRVAHGLRALSAHLQDVREKERTDLARELHDSLGQSLTSTRISLSVLQRRLESEKSSLSNSVTRRFTEISEALGEAIGAVKAISTELRPGVLDQLGLPAAIEWQCREFSRRSGIECEFKVPRRKIVLGADVSTALFRVFQEALTNVARHAQATKVTVVLSVDRKGLSLTVSDNGRGIAQSELVAPDSLGLLGMRERMEAIGGEFSIVAAPGKGTVVSTRAKARKAGRGKVK